MVTLIEIKYYLNVFKLISQVIFCLVDVYLFHIYIQLHEFIEQTSEVSSISRLRKAFEQYWASKQECLENELVYSLIELPKIDWIWASSTFCSDCFLNWSNCIRTAKRLIIPLVLPSNEFWPNCIHLI